MKNRENDHYNDAAYELYRRGYNPDRLDYEKSYNDYTDGRSPQYTANREIEKQRDKLERKRQMEEDYYLTNDDFLYEEKY